MGDERVTAVTSVLDLAEVADDDALYFSSTDEDGQFHELSLKRSRFDALGEPEQITIRITPGDTIGSLEERVEAASS